MDCQRRDACKSIPSEASGTSETGTVSIRVALPASRQRYGGRQQFGPGTSRGLHDLAAPASCKSSSQRVKISRTGSHNNGGARQCGWGLLKSFRRAASYSRCRYVTMMFAFSGWSSLCIRHETELSWGLLVAHHLLTDPVALRSLADTCSKLGTGSECQCAAATPLAWFSLSKCSKPDP